MPGIEDWINKPLEIIQNIYSTTPSECHKKVSEYFNKRIIEHGLPKIPSLNDCPSHELPSNSLVRLRCMVQDMFDPEFFMGSYEVVHMPSQKRYMRTGMYKDVADCQSSEEVDLDSPQNKTMDRLTFYTISIPGENEWIQKNYSSKNNISPLPSMANSQPRNKRSYSNDMSSCGNDIDECSMETETGNSNDNKRSRTVTNENDEASKSQSENQIPVTLPDLNLPIPESKGIACIVKVYEQGAISSSSSMQLTSQALKINDVIEVVGILSVDPSLAHQNVASPDSDLMEGAQESTAELLAHNPPPSLVPRLHAVVLRKLDHVNPYLPWDVKAENHNSICTEILARAPDLRAELHSFLTKALLGDQLAAEYLLCHLISSIYVRKDVVALGKFSLNLTNVPILENYTVKLYQAISQLVTKSHWFPLSLTNLNTSTLTPKKDFVQNRLRTGLLQLSSHTHFILDETALSVGRLEELGVRNMTALGNLIHWQRVEYDFSFNRMEFTTDMAVLVLSEGKSLLPSDCRIPLEVSPNTGGPEKEFLELSNHLNEKWLEEVRCYLTLLKLVDYTMSEDLQKNVQEDFVQMRKENKGISADDLHSLLVLARFLSLSHGETSLSKESWEKAKNLEKERKLRLNVQQIA